VSDDLERRLRESLHAYADLVEPRDDEAVPTGSAARPRSTNRRWRGAVLAAAAAAAVVSGSVWLVDAQDTPPSAGPASDVQASETGTSESDAQAAAGAADSATEALASVPGVGDSFPVDLYTHCGVLGLDIGGVWFAADPPLVEGPAGPPPGWGDPEQPGTATMLAADRAVFRDDQGHEVPLRADDGARPPPCE